VDDVVRADWYKEMIKCDEKFKKLFTKGGMHERDAVFGLYSLVSAATLIHRTH
jgi:hypothetical protein